MCVCVCVCVCVCLCVCVCVCVCVCTMGQGAINYKNNGTHNFCALLGLYTSSIYSFEDQKWRRHMHNYGDLDTVVHFHHVVVSQYS